MARKARAAKERRWRNFVVAAMASPYTLPALGGSILAAVVLGIHLGQSSVGLINPIYFQGPALHPRERGAAIDENAVRPRPPAYGQLYGWDEGSAARAADCVGCETVQAHTAYAYSAQVPYFGSREELREADRRERARSRAAWAQQEAQREELQEFAVEEVVEPKPPVLRYAYYPIEEPVEEPEPVDAKPDGYYEE
ncbi:MAG: hypothetical protein M3177_06835 [Pseudomonadota bacterium]|nr:hypothetical protein [Pseudomonadota bacterium]